MKNSYKPQSAACTRLQRRLLFSQMKVSHIPLSEPKFPLSSSSLGPIHTSNGIHHSGQGNQAHGSGKEYKDPPALR